MAGGPVRVAAAMAACDVVSAPPDRAAGSGSAARETGGIADESVQPVP
jgi:hypothetical protein